MGSRGRWEGRGESLPGMRGPCPPPPPHLQEVPIARLLLSAADSTLQDQTRQPRRGAAVQPGELPSLPHGVLGLSPQGGRDSNRADHSEPGLPGGSRSSPGRGLASTVARCSVSQPRLLAGTEQGLMREEPGESVVTAAWKEPAGRGAQAGREEAGIRSLSPRCCRSQPVTAGTTGGQAAGQLVLSLGVCTRPRCPPRPC